MKKNNLTRALALVLAVACTLTLVAAVDFDLNGDGKVNVWDLQLAANQGKADEGALIAALGGADELHPNAQGVYEIHSVLGLYNMAKHATEGATFELMADIDMTGYVWTPVVGFFGTLEGNNKTISNVTIDTSVDTDTGFFAYLDRKNVGGKTMQAQVRNLNLKNVTITAQATADARYIGLLTGSNRGVIDNCTATGSVTDTRAEYANKVYVGAITGRNNNDNNYPGKVIPGTKLTASAGSSNNADQVTGLTAKMAMFFNETGTVARQVGIAGYSTAEVEGAWQDTTGSVEYKSQTERTRRQTAVDAMYQMGSVEWTAGEEFTYVVNDNIQANTSNVFIPGRTYIGIPYNGSGLSYEHFLSVMQKEKDEQGRYVTVPGLENGTNAKTGFAAMMGNDCSSAVAWAWAAALPATVNQNGVRVDSTSYMVPNTYNTKNYGVLPAGGYETLPVATPKGADARDTRSIIELNGGDQGIAEYYAKSSRGDALLFVEYELKNDTWTKGGGHARLLAYDPVIIRGGDGKIDLDRSYVITHEQGDGVYGNRLPDGSYETYKGYNLKKTSWRTDYKYSLSILLTKEGYDEAKKNPLTHPGSGYGYVPVTAAGFSVESDLREPYLDPGYRNESNYHPVILPNDGWYYSNYMLVKLTMVIEDGQGNEIYNKTAFMSYRGRSITHQTAKLEELFPDAKENLEEGQTYYETLTALFGNGTTLTKLDKKAFTYPSDEILLQ